MNNKTAPVTEGSEQQSALFMKYLKPFVLLVAFAAMYYDSVIHSISKWNTIEGSHGPLILAVSFYLVWMKRHDLKRLPDRPAIIPGVLLAGSGCFVLFAGKLSSTMLLQQLSLIPVLLGFILLLHGWSYFRALLIPVGYLIFMTGIIEMALSGIVIYLQLISAWISAKLLALTGMPVLLEGTIVGLPHISLEVVRSCSGISHIVSLMALSIPLAFMGQLTPLRKLILVIASFLIGIFANGVRIASIGIYAIYNEGADLHGPNETLYVSFIFFFGMIVLIILSQLLSKKKSPVSAVEVEVATDQQIGNETDTNIDPVTVTDSNTATVTKPWIIAGSLFLVTLGFIHLYKISPVELENSFTGLPTTIAGFSARDLRSFDERLHPFPADSELLRSYVDSSGNRVDVYIGYLAEQSRERKLIDYRRNWLHNDTQTVKLGSNSAVVAINKTRFDDRFNPAEIYFWYLMDDRIITSQYVGKIYTFLEGLLKRRTNGAVVVVQTRSNEEEVLPFLDELVPVVRRHLTEQER